MVKRYMWSFAEKFGQGLFVNDKGEYVKYEDYAALQQKLDAMAADNAELNSAANALIKTSEECEINGDEIKHVVGTDEFENLFDCVEKTPATDAYLNSVRAEGVEILTSKLQTLIDEGVFDDKEIGVAAGAVYEGARIAANLRSGTHDTADKAG